MTFTDDHATFDNVMVNNASPWEMLSYRSG